MAIMSGPAWPKIRKAKRVTGRTLVFRDAVIDDAPFILGQRTDAKKARFLSMTPPDLDAQKKWLEAYAQDTDQAYFVIELKETPVGTVRLYDARRNSFCWGSWILIGGLPSQAAMESALIVYAYALDHLGFEASHFDVRRGNERVWSFHERFGAQRTTETNLDYFYSIECAAIRESLRRYRKFLPSGVTVEH